MTAPRPTDHAGRDLARFHREVVRGQAGGQVIWQPRIGCWLDDKLYLNEPLPDGYAGCDLKAIYERLGVSARLYQFNACFVANEDPRVHGSRVASGERETTHRIETPVGVQTAVTRTTPTNKGSIWVKRWIETEADLRVATWRAERTSYRFCTETYQRLLAEWGHLGAPTMYQPRETIQDLFINTMGVERAIYALVDWPAAVAGYFTALNEAHLRLVEVICESPVEIINFGDNLHAATLSPRLFEQHVLPVYQERCARLRAAGKFVHAHWDGDVWPLLRYARETGLNGIEAITPQPQGDVTLEQIREALGDDMWLLDGIPAIYFDAMWPEETLLACVDRLLELFAPRIILGISDELSSTGDIDRIRLVTARIDDHNAALAAAAGG